MDVIVFIVISLKCLCDADTLSWPLLSLVLEVRDHMDHATSLKDRLINLTFRNDLLLLAERHKYTY